MKLNIFDPSLGVQTVLEPRPDDARLPEARALSTGAADETGLAELFGAPSLSSALREALSPRIGDDSLLRPDVILTNLREAGEFLREVKTPEVRRFVRQDLDPLLEDTQLLATYAGLLLEG
ncbi:MAG: type III secretion protein [Deltaproteobacteria bacterium]|jgi:type III secretion protein X|nr:type III secretion protein [Deltaproteobacteria bacterium]